MSTRPGQPDRLSCLSEGRLGKGLVGPRRGSGAGSDRNRLLGARTDHGLRRTPELLLYRRPLFPTLATQWRHAHMHAAGRRRAWRLVKRLQPSDSLGRQGDRGSHLAADPLAYVPRDPRWLRQGIGELMAATRPRTL